MTSPLFIVSAVVGLIGVGCAITGAAIARKQIRAALILNAVFMLLMGTSIQVRIWSERLEDQRGDFQLTNEAKAVAMESIAIARSASSVEVREEALKTAERAARLDIGHADPAGGIVSLSEILALGSIMLGSVSLTLALTRPDLLTRRIAKPVAASVESRP